MRGNTKAKKGQLITSLCNAGCDLRAGDRSQDPEITLTAQHWS